VSRTPEGEEGKNGEAREPTHAHGSPPRVARAIETAILRVGQFASWIWLLLIFVIVTGVTLRYVFGAGRIELEELQWHLYAIGFLVGLSVCVTTDSHVRIDVLRERIPPRLRAWIELYGLLLLLLPFVALILTYAAPFVLKSFARAEISQSPGGLPFRWLIKGALFLGFAGVGAAAFARILRLWRELFDDGKPAEPHSQGGAG